ncbi:hypothetical protein [Nocardioides sambongensis]|uniref:hypothetical protein n=1 Tax=Nocardioides sambongensis TaxID=2589074 RepID=UPI0015E8680C|nr:hypothetical protein [Nocardioides sambongensis]
MTLFSLVVTVLVTIGMVVLILLFERKRAEGIQRDLRRRRPDEGLDGPDDRPGADRP